MKISCSMFIYIQQLFLKYLYQEGIYTNNYWELDVNSGLNELDYQLYVSHLKFGGKSSCFVSYIFIFEVFFRLNNTNGIKVNFASEKFYYLVLL